MAFQQAQSYLQGMPNPFDGVLEAYGQGQTLRQNRDLLQAQQAEQARKIQAQQQLETLDWDDMGAVSRVVAQFPEYTKGAQDYYKSMEAKEQQATLSTLSRGVSALGSSNPQVGIDLLRNEAIGHRNAGNIEKADEIDGLADWAEQDPQSARKAMLMNLAIMSPDKSGANLESYGKALNPQRKEVDAGDAIYSYDIDQMSGDIGGAEWVVDKSATPDNVLDNQTSIANTTQTNMVSEGNNIRTNATSENNNIRSNTVSENNNIRSNQVSENNNIRSNAVSEGNNIRSNQTSRLNQQDANDLKKYGIDVNAANAANILEARRQDAEIAAKKGKHQTFGGQVYVTYPDGTATPALDSNGKPIYDNKVDAVSQAADRKEMQRIEKLKILIPEIKTLLSSATGSRTGAAWDATLGAVGYATEGRKTTAQLQTLSGQIVSMMPRMEGPQSDKDVAMYKEMAGNIGDPTKTTAERMAALQTIEKLNNQYEKLSKRNSSSGGSNQSNQSSGSSKRSNLFN